MMKINFKSELKQSRRIKVTPNYDKKREENRYLKIIQKRNKNYMFNIDFYDKYLKMKENHAFQKISRYCSKTKIKNIKLKQQSKEAIIIEFLIINNNNYRYQSPIEKLNFSEDRQENEELNDFAKNYWKGCNRKFQEHILEIIEEKLVKTTTEMLEQMNNFNELLELLDCLISIPNFNKNDWKNTVNKHNNKTINKMIKNKNAM